MNSEAIEMLYWLMGGIIGLLVVFLIALIVIKRKMKKKRNYSLSNAGSDSSEESNMLIEKFRNERVNQRDAHLRKFELDEE